MKNVSLFDSGEGKRMSQLEVSEFKNSLEIELVNQDA